MSTKCTQRSHRLDVNAPGHIKKAELLSYCVSGSLVWMSTMEDADSSPEGRCGGWGGSFFFLVDCLKGNLDEDLEEEAFLGHCFFPLPWPLPAIRRMRRMPQMKKNYLNIIMLRWTGDATNRLEMKTDESDVCQRPFIPNIQRSRQIWTCWNSSNFWWNYQNIGRALGLVIIVWQHHSMELKTWLRI